MTFPGGQTAADADISAATLADVTHIEWRTAPAAGDDDPVFLTAATNFTVLGVDNLAPNWGDPVDGIQAGLSVDRAKFSLGEKVLLHLRWENVTAAVPLAQGEGMEPVPDLEIQDSQHNVLRTIPTVACMTGHGWGPFAIQNGKTQRIFRELTTKPPPVPQFVTPLQADLPGPGVYYLVSVWSPRVLDTSDAETDKSPRIGVGGGRFGKVYATARSRPVRVEVVPGNNP